MRETSATRFKSLSTEDRLKEPVSGLSVLSGLTNFMKLYLTYLVPKGHTLTNFSQWFDPGWELPCGTLCAELVFTTTVPYRSHATEVQFIVPCYFTYGGSEVDIRCDVYINGEYDAKRSFDIVCLNVNEARPTCPQRWADELEKALRESPKEGD